MNLNDTSIFKNAHDAELQEYGPRVLLYSHDTFGLGHIRRSRTIASALTASNEAISAVIITGSPIAGRFTFPDRVDHIRLPGVKKLQDGSYMSESLGMSIEQTAALRSGLIQTAIEQYNPAIFIVDKEPTGFRGELIETLEWLKANTNTKIILGLRDVLDSPELLSKEWERKGAIKAMETYYDEIWVYGLKTFYNPIGGLEINQKTKDIMHWTGYLRRETYASTNGLKTDGPYILVTPGGGGDGEMMVDSVLSAYEADPELNPPAILVYGPFLSGQRRSKFEKRVKKLNGRVRTTGFESNMENLMAKSEAVIAMGGYNTFCEILSFDKPAIIIPRTIPRMEQFIRATSAEDLGLVRMLDRQRDGLGPNSMIKAIKELKDQKPPSASNIPDFLNGLDYIAKRVECLLEH